MADFSRLVRPYQVPDYTPPRQPPRTAEPSQDFNVVIGKGTGAVRLYHVSLSYSFTKYADKKVKEETE